MMYANPNEVQKKQMKCKTDILRRILVNDENSEINSRKTPRKSTNPNEVQKRR